MIELKDVKKSYSGRIFFIFNRFLQKIMTNSFIKRYNVTKV